MAEQLDVFKCPQCGMLVEVIVGCDCRLICCGKEMEKLEAKTADAATEKHVPVIEQVEGGYKVKVGSVPHPMTDEHYIQWIELQTENQIHAQCLKPGDAPEAVFKVTGTPTAAREHCNVHGLWKGQ